MMKDLLNYLRKVFYTPLMRITNYFETHTYQKVFPLPYVYLDKEQKYDHGSSTETDSESVFGLGWYARSGFEFRVRQKGMIGLSARWNWANADFSEMGGSSEIEGFAVFASYTAGF